jgi:multiple sugar transport system permease protein
MVLITLLAIFFVMPLYWMFVGSFREMMGAMATPQLIPKNPTLHNYYDLLTSRYPVLRWLFNSIVVAGASTFLSVLLCCMMGYAFAKKNFPGKNVLFMLVLAAMMLPKQASLIPLFITVKNLGLVNNLLGAVLPNISWPYGIFLLRQFAGQVPEEMFEAARIEGAGELTQFFRILIPLCKPAISTMAILMFMQAWGDFMWQLIVLKDLQMWSINVGLSVIIKNPTAGSASVINYGLAMAGATIGAIPVSVLFICFQKHFIKGITLGAVKE